MHHLPTTHEGSTDRGRRWALVLAAGDGTRLGHLTRDRQGRPTPKQFCSVSGGPTLLEETLARGIRLAGRRRVVAVVAAQHDPWWRQDTVAMPAGNVVVQPLNRGTAAGILLPLLTIAFRDPDARVAVLPSDHFVDDEAVLDAAIRRGFEASEREPSTLVLLGMTPDRPDTELGWILPGASGPGSALRVERFVEKPPLPVARVLQRRGGLWNSFIFVARAATLLELYRRTMPRLFGKLLAAATWNACVPADAEAVRAIYAALDSRDFSRDLLETNADALRVLEVPPCGWSDLGTPERLARCAALVAPPRPHPAPGAPPAGGRPVLAAVI